MATAPVSFNNTTDPRKAAANNRQYLTAQGDALQQQYGDQYRAQQGGAPVNTVAGTAGYLNNLESPLAAGQGGYSPDEANQIQLSGQDKGQIQLGSGDKSQIEYSPADVQGIVNKAGISAGQRTAADVNSAERAAAASGGSPAALATYRARATQQGGVAGADAMTDARVAAKNAQSGAAATAAGLQTSGAATAKELESAGGQAVGNARLAQQNQGLQYYQGQNTQANQNAQQANQLQESTYGTEANAGNAATDTAVKASQTPTTGDKIIGGITGVLGALADGTMPSGADAVVGENGPEWVGKPKYLADGDLDAITEIDPSQSYGTDYSGQPQPKQPFWKRLAGQMQDKPAAQSQPQQPWNPVTPYAQAGKAVGNLAKLAFLDDGATPADGDPADHMAYDDPYPPAASVPPRSMLAQGTVFTRPTAIKTGPDDAVVPLSYRAQAKVRPSMALNKPKTRMPYGAAA